MMEERTATRLDELIEPSEITESLAELTLFILELGSTRDMNTQGRKRKKRHYNLSSALNLRISQEPETLLHHIPPSLTPSLISLMRIRTTRHTSSIPKRNTRRHCFRTSSRYPLSCQRSSPSPSPSPSRSRGRAGVVIPHPPPRGKPSVLLLPLPRPPPPHRSALANSLFCASLRRNCTTFFSPPPCAVSLSDIQIEVRGGGGNGNFNITYGERLRVNPVLDHGDADRQGPAVEMAVLNVLPNRPLSLSLISKPEAKKCAPQHTITRLGELGLTSIVDISCKMSTACCAACCFSSFPAGTGGMAATMY